MLTIKHIDVESELKNRGYYPTPEHEPPVIDHGVHNGVHDVPDIHIPAPTPIIHIAPITHDGVHDVPDLHIPVTPPDTHTQPLIHHGVHDLPDLHIPVTPIEHHGVHQLPDIHIPVDRIQESKFAKYFKFLPLAVLLVPEKDIIDLGRVI